MPVPSRLISSLPPTAPPVGATVQSVLNILHERIVSGVYGTGRLPAERQLAQELGVARNTLREALDILERQQMIRRRAGAGSFVAPGPEGTAASVAAQTGPLHLQVMRGIVEPEMVRLAIMSMSPRQIDGLAETLAQMAGADAATLARLEETFLRQIAEGTGNPLLVACHALISEARRQDTRRRPASNLHHLRALFEAISERDIETACEVMRLLLLDDQRALMQGPD